MLKLKYIWPYLLIILSIVFLVIINIASLRNKVSQNLDYSNTIVKASRQRMLSQLLTKMSYKLWQKSNDADLKEMKGHLEAWNQAHKELQSAQSGALMHIKTHPESALLLRKIDPVQTQLYEAFEQVAAGKIDKDLMAKIDDNERIFLAGMEKLMTQLQLNARKDLIKTERDQRLHFLLSGGFLLLLILLFILPYHRKLVHAFKKVKTQQLEIEDLNNTNQLIISGINAGIWETEIGTDNEKWSPNFYKILGYEPGEMKPSYDTFLNYLLHPDDKAALETALALHLEQKMPYQLEIRMRNKDGTYKWYTSSGLAIWDAAGKPLRMAGSIVDIQENVAYKQQLEYNQFLLEETSKLARVAGWEYDLETGRTRWSQMMHHIMEIPVGADMELKERINSYPPEYHALIGRSLAEAITKGEPFDIELELLTPGDKRKWIRTIGTPEKDEHGNVVKLRGIYQDIHKRKLRELELAKARQELEQANHAKDKIFSIISHDMKGPLNNLRALIDLQKENIISREEFEAHIEDLKKTVNPLTEALDNILYWAQSQMQGFTVNAKNFGMTDIIERTVHLYQSSCMYKRISLSYNHAPVKDAYADPDHAFLIVRNLVNNAIKFTPEGGTIKIETGTDNGHVVTSISDTGIGMTPDELKLITEHQNHYTSRGTQGEKGTGLGLSMCYELSAKNNGKLLVESEKGKGTTFTLLLPEAVI